MSQWQWMQAQLILGSISYRTRKLEHVAKSFTKYCCQVGIPSCVTTDNGQEFGRLFRELCDQKGTRSVRSEPYCPARNGLVERRNSLLKRMSRSMLVQSGMPMRYWPCTIQTAVYLLNRLPTKRLQGRTPHEAMHGFKPARRQSSVSVWLNML